MRIPLTSSLKQPEIIQILKSFGFEGLRLIDSEGKTSTYKFRDFDPGQLKKSLDSPTLAAGGKVMVFRVPKVARLGVSSQNSVVRFIDQTKDSGGVGTSHLGKIKLSPALSKAFLQASASPRLHLPFCKKLWEYLNAEKFGGKLPMPKFTSGSKAPMSGHARGVYFGGPRFTAGTIWMASFMFNAREPFFVEVFLHEMCHQAKWCISHSTDNSEKGHGPVWRQWMVDVGLDPRRYDPTDEHEYKTGADKLEDDANLTHLYGPRASQKEIDALVPFPNPHGGCVLVYKGRIMEGRIEGLRFIATTHGKPPFSLSYKSAKSLNAQQFYHRK